ncbi:MAG: YceD family protein [Beijerinckiaceae bacterium]
MIAAHLDLASCEAVSAELTVIPSRSDVLHVTGQLRATLHQTCIVTLDPLPVDIDEEIDVRYAPPEKLGPISKAEVERTLEDEDPPEPLEDGNIDLWMLAIDYLSVALDPYPRKIGAEIPESSGDQAKESPFAALAALKMGLEK